MASVFTSELKEGMLTQKDCYSTNGRVILPKDTMITKNIISKLIENNVLFVEIYDTSADTDVNIDLMSLINDFEDDGSFVKSEEFRNFKQLYDTNLENFKSSINDIVYKNKNVNLDSLLESTDSIISVTTPSGLLNMISNLKEYDDSTFIHSLNVALICNILGRWLNLSEEKLNLITTCGLLHDVGKLLIPDEIIKKPGKLTEQEFKIIKYHPKLGYDLLGKHNLPLEIRYSALMHHEKCDGSGYPLGIKGDQIHWCAQIITIADIYEAMTATRVYRGALSPFDVIRTFEDDGLKKFNPQYLLTFLENVVNSFLNCKVRLSNGDEGDIVYINKINLSKPMIKCKDKFIDLSSANNVSIESIL